MLITIVLILSICMATILLTIHNRDEVHRIIAFLSGLIAILCVFILSPPLIKGLLGLLFFILINKIFPDYKSFR